MFRLFALLAFSLNFFIACGPTDTETGDYKSFKYDLQGIWESPAGSFYYGGLEISYNSIKIIGYDEWLIDDEKLPFRGFTKEISLSGYSEEDSVSYLSDYKEGRFFIKNAGELDSSVSYRYWKETATYPYSEFLRFNFGGRYETLQKIYDYY